MNIKINQWLIHHLGGHVNIGRRLTIYGWNAMHVAINFWTRRWGYICFHPHIKVFGHLWPWYFYVSPNATPWAASWGVGPGFRDDRDRSRRRDWTNIYRRMSKLNYAHYDIHPVDDYWRGVKDALDLADNILMEHDSCEAKLKLVIDGDDERVEKREITES